MQDHILTGSHIVLFQQHLKQEDREQSTIEKYLRELRLFAAWLADRPVTAEIVADWKNHLRTEGYKSETINSKLSSLNKFFTFMQWPECRMKYLKIQRKMFRSPERELAKEEYLRLLETADTLGKARLGLLIETICATGIRVSEVKYITMEAMKAAFYYRQGSKSFGCLLPDEKEKLRAFLDTEQKHKAEERQKNNRRLNFEKR